MFTKSVMSTICCLGKKVTQTFFNNSRIICHFEIQIDKEKKEVKFRALQVNSKIEATQKGIKTFTSKP